MLHDVTRDRATGQMPAWTMPARTTGRRAGRATGPWADVAIGDAQVCADAVDGQPSLKVKADVRLCALLPADVRVELVELDATRVPLRCVQRRRMFSAVPLLNGTYRYEAELPLADDAAAHAWVVRVVPADALAHAPDARAVERWIGVEPAAAEVTGAAGVR